MKLVKSLLLGSAAGIAAVAGAHAADLPSRKSAPVEYVRVCSAYGAGFFYIPGTDTCLRVGGRVRAEYAVGTRFGDFQDSYGTRARGRLNIDARTATAYGTLRTFFRYELTNNSGIYNVGAITPFNTGIVVPGTTRAFSSTGSSPNLDLAFIQFGPITAGRAQSFFDFYANDYNFASTRTSDTRLNLLAYTATFGSGFSATISAEDRVSGTSNRELPGVTFNPNTGAFGAAVVQGQDFPDLVGSLRVDQGWGSAQLSGAVGQRKYAVGNTIVAGLAPVDGDEMVWAIQGGVKINLPMLAAGDNLILQAAYADGALGYLGWYPGSFGVGRLGALTLADASINTLTGSVNNSSGFSLVAALKHYWTPQLRTEITASYSELKLKYNNAGTFGAFPRSLDPKEYNIAANLIWSPVSGLDIGVEVLYTHLDIRNQVGVVDNFNNRSTILGIKNDDALAGRFRIQRDF
ncbi:porin [Bosea lathyri]|uniref:Porin n=1 Tax=Bosea lathyri TaxID=1036778 RepID=A0A1H6CEN9_9HYPH|nr:porin [Bosea lathyri]SEG71471.1 Porin subfamily protein [Bosea lathyri]